MQLFHAEDYTEIALFLRNRYFELRGLTNKFETVPPDVQMSWEQLAKEVVKMIHRKEKENAKKKPH